VRSQWRYFSSQRVDRKRSSHFGLFRLATMSYPFMKIIFE
jgi:hypothetical protein